MHVIFNNQFSKYRNRFARTAELHNPIIFRKLQKQKRTKQNKE